MKALLFSALSLFAVFSARADFVYPSPPAGYVPSASPTTAFSGVMQSNNSFVIDSAGNIRGGFVTQKVLASRQAVKIPFLFKMAQSAPAVIARRLFFNPAVIGVTAAIWLAESCLKHKTQGWVVDCSDGSPPLPVGFVYRHSDTFTWRANMQSAMDDVFPLFVPAGLTGQVINGSCVDDGIDFPHCFGNFIRPDGSIANSDPLRINLRKKFNDELPGGTAVEPALTETQFVDIAQTRSMPPSVFSEAPSGTPIPMGSVKLNPDATTAPQSHDLSVPIGSPRPIPGTNPQLYKQDVIKLKPSPTPESPFRFDAVPETAETDSAQGITDESHSPETPTQQTPEDKKTDLCKDNPDILACQKLGEVPDAQPIVNDVVNLSLNKDSGWGASTGVCPAPRSFSVMNQTFSVAFTPICDFALMIRPLFIAFAWLSSVLIFFGFAKKE